MGHDLKQFMIGCTIVLGGLAASSSVYAFSCAGIAGLTDTLTAGTPTSSGTDSTSEIVDVEVGDTIDFTFTKNNGGGSHSISLAAAPGGVTTGSLGTFSASGTLQYVVTVAGSYTFNYNSHGSGPYVVAFSATCSGATAPPPPPVTPPTSEDEISDATDANDRALDGTRLENDPTKLPSANASEPNAQAIEDLLKERDRIVIELAETRSQLAEAHLEIEEEASEFEKAIVGFVLPIDVGVVEARSRRRLFPALLSIIDQLEQQEQSIRNRIVELGGDPNLITDFTPDDPEDLGDGQNLLFFPLGANTGGAPNSSAYNAITASASGVNTQFVHAADGFNIWSRFKFSLLQGTLGREGIAGNMQLGFVKSPMPGLDLGAFASGYFGEAISTTLSSKTTSQGIGVGGYVKYAIGENLSSGVSVSYERSTNDITIGNATGTYLRDLLALNASLSGNFDLGDFTLAPSANIIWNYSNRHAYTNSSPANIPASVTSSLTASAGLLISRTFLVLEGDIHSFTPSLGGNVNYHITGQNNLNLAGGNTIVESPFTAALNAGLNVEFLGGAALNVGANLSGLAGTTQIYSATLGVSVPID